MKVTDFEISASECPEQNQHTSEPIDRGMHCKNKSCMERETMDLNKEEHTVRADQCEDLHPGKDQQEENCRILQTIKELMASGNEGIQGTTQMREIEAFLQQSQWEERDNNDSALSHSHGVSQKSVQCNNEGVRTLLTRLVLELAHGKQNLKLAAAAGNSLLEQVAVLQKEKTAIISSLDAKILDYECAQADNARLKKVCEGMEQELRHYDATLGNRNDTTNEIGSLSAVKIGLEGKFPKHDSVRVQEHASRQDAPESCKLCERLEAERKLLVTEKERVQRRCLDLEMDQERSQRSWTELNHLCKRNELCLKRVQAEYTKALEDMEYMATQIQCLKEDQRSSGVKRDKLSQTTQKLQTENEMMKTLLEERLGIIQQLRTEKSASVTQAQWYETRVATLTAEKKQLLDVMEQCHERLSYLEEENRERNLLQKQVADLEMLIEEAHQKWMQCSQENRSLRTRFSSASEQYADECLSSKNFQSEQESTAADVLESHTSMQSRNDTKVDGKNLVIVDYQVDEFLECEDTGTSCSEELDYAGGQQVGGEPPKMSVCVSSHEVNTNSSLYIGISLIACATALRLYLRK